MLNRFTQLTGIAPLFLLLSLMFAMATAPVSADDMSLSHWFKIYGDAELTGFQTENEPRIAGEGIDDSGMIGRLSLGMIYTWRDLLSAHLLIVSEGASRYGLVLDNDHPSFYGIVEKARGSDWLPVVDTAELKIKSPGESFYLSTGLIRPQTQSKYALPGLLAGTSLNGFNMELWWVDAGKRQSWFQQDVQLENGLEVRDAVSAEFYGIRLDKQWNSMRCGLEVTMLHDETPDWARWNIIDEYWGEISQDTLGTVWFNASGEFSNWGFQIQGARNFGHAESAEGHGDFNYAGVMADASVTWYQGLMSVTARYLYQSGNPFPKPGLSNEESQGIPFRTFKGFAYYPPTNGALYDSHYFKENGPPVLLGSRMTPYYGVPRPNQHGDNSATENLIAPSLSMTLTPYPGLSLMATIWQLTADEVYWVYDGDHYFQPSDDLGIEINAECSWTPVPHVTLKAFYGCLMLGDFYHEIEPYYPYGLTYRGIYEWLDRDTVEVAELGVTLWF